MATVTSGTTHKLADVAAFMALLRAPHQHPQPAVRTLFTGGELVVARAPGRLDLMGGIADYSGSLVLQLPIAEATLAAVERTSDPELRIVSLGDDPHRGHEFRLPLAELWPAGQPLEYAAAQSLFKRDARAHWAAYAAGAFLVLAREKGARFSGGARILIQSAVPEGKGVSSSAAIEVAVMSAVAAAWHLKLAARELAMLCQMVENRVVGAPCGVMDQMSSAAGEAGSLLHLLCQPAELGPAVTLPAGVAVWGLDSGIRHAVSGADYGSVRVGAFMGYRILAALAELPVLASAVPGRVQIMDARWGGYLANVTPSEFDGEFAARLPERLTGAEFLTRYGGSSDPITQIDPAREYAIRLPTRHPVAEHHRVRCFAELLALPSSPRRLALLGELMYQSHASYGACGLGSSGTDRLVDLVRAAGPAKGLYGAKITGGGSGGTVAILGRADAEPAVRAVAEQYARETGHHPYLFAGSSPGAAAFGTLVLTPGT